MLVYSAVAVDIVEHTLKRRTPFRIFLLTPTTVHIQYFICPTLKMMPAETNLKYLLLYPTH